MKPEWKAIVDFIREFGFPSLVCLWFMWRDGRREEKMGDNMNRLLSAVSTMTEALEAHEKE